MAKVGLIGHPKTAHLAALLGIEKFSAVGLLECLFTYTGQVAPNGLIGRWPDAVIAADGCFWVKKKPAILINALVESGWLIAAKDEAFALGLECPEADAAKWYVHDWHVHAQNWVREKLREESSTFYFGHAAKRPEGRPAKEPKPIAKPAEKLPENIEETQKKLSLNSVKTQEKPSISLTRGLPLPYSSLEERSNQPTDLLEVQGDTPGESIDLDLKEPEEVPEAGTRVKYFETEEQIAAKRRMLREQVASGRGAA